MAMVKRLLSLLLSCFSWYLISLPSPPYLREFTQCLREKLPSELVYEQSSSSFTDVLGSSNKNPRFFTNATVRPLCIVTPNDARHVQAAMLCGRRHGVRLRVRSGGHDYEGLSYRSARPDDVFGVLDLANLRSVSVNHSESTAWVDSGATLGELYYAIAKNNSWIAFPAGECPTVGVGGQFSGGGIGMLMRKYGLSIDNVLDAKMVNANGDLLDRVGMGEDLFWAIRGGGSESFGVVLSWKIQLVQVPPTVTVFSIGKTLDQGAIDILTRWQVVGPSLPDDLTIRVKVQGQEALFLAMYLGTCSSLVATMGRRFPEHSMTSADCRSITWLQSTALSFTTLANIGTPEDVLLNRTGNMSFSFKGKSDYVRRPISKAAWKDIFSWYKMSGSGYIMLEPHGGFMDNVPADATPHPHRDSVLYIVQYLVFWQGDGGTAAPTAWLDDFYGFMGQHVSTNPRRAYVNFRDLDIGQNVVVDDMSTFDGGEVWGERYFMSNYRRLVTVKAAVDPTDYFRNEQSIPPLL
ncbi:hypothetical protein ACQ4PT_049007 [Festuca glaucescens]